MDDPHRRERQMNARSRRRVAKVNVEEVKKLAESALADAHYQKNTKKAAGKRNGREIPAS